MISALQRFWSRVDKSGDCWMWTGSLTEKGYGAFTAEIDGHKFWRAHRFAWFLNNGPILWDQQVLHTCDQRACVNPDHLFLGTNAENMADKVAKGRHKPGEQHHNAKLTDEKVKYILSSPKNAMELSKELGVHNSQIYRIRKGERWSHVTSGPRSRT